MNIANVAYYTGVGSRNAPLEILNFMVEIAEAIRINPGPTKYYLRTGDAKGSDQAFYDGCKGQGTQYHPYQANSKAMEIAKRFHPAWNKLSPFIKSLHARNAFQVLGLDLKTPSSWLICWTPDACKCHADRKISTGGTGTAISIADHYGVKIYNLADIEDLLRWEDYVKYMKKL